MIEGLRGRMMGFVLVISLMGLFVTAGAGNALAVVPSSAEPGIVLKSFEEKDRPRSRLEDIVTVPKMDEAAGKVSDAKVFELKSVVLDRSTSYKTEDFKGIYGKYIGKKVSFADLNAIARAMTRKYREDGYIFSRVIVPPQKVESGVVHFQAIEGRISKVEVTGTFKDNDGLVAALADKIRAAGPANTKEIERYLLLIDDLPGLTARSLIKPSATPGGGDLVIAVEEDSFEGSASLDNRGSRYIGPYRGTLVGAFNSVFGIHDRTTLRGILAAQTNELRFGDITHEEQIGSEGGKIKARAAFTRSEPGGNVASQDIVGDSQSYDLEGSYPITRSRHLNVNVLAGLNALNSTTNVLGVQTAEDHVRSLRAGTHFDFTDSLRGVTQIDALVTQGLSGLGANGDGTGRSRASGHHDFLKGNLTVTRDQELVDLWSLEVSGTGQMSRDSLLSSEQFTVGGPSYGRAYDSGEIAGDAGFAGYAELRYGGPVNSELIQSYQAYGFLDYGHVSTKNPGAGETAGDSLSSTGIGVRFNAIRNISGYVELDQPLNKKVASESDAGTRLFFNALVRF